MIGSKLRNLRKSKELTLKELAAQTGFTAGYISQLERDMTEPSISALSKICKALDIELYYFLDDNKTDYYVTRADSRQKIDLPKSKIIYEFASPMGLQQDIKPKVGVLEICIDPKEWSSDEFFNHDADEVIMSLEGEVVIAINDEEISLKEGDTIYLKAKVMHKFYNPTDKRIKILSIITPPIY